jgi:rhodanese-related sulfurtransferase
MTSATISFLFSLSLFGASVSAKEMPPIRQPNETAGCEKTRGIKSHMDLDFAMAIRLFYSDNLPRSQQFHYHIDPDKLYCYKNHETHTIELFETKEPLGEVDVELMSPPFKMSNIWAESQTLLAKYPDLSGFARVIRMYMNLNFPDLTDQEPIQLMSLGKIRKSNNFVNAYSSLTPAVHRFAKTLDYEGTAKLVATIKPFVIDLRPDSDFKMWHLPNAHNFHILANPLVPGLPFDEKEYVALQSYVPLSQLPPDKQAPLLLMGFSLKDSGAYYIAMTLVLAGYRNLYWYRGGREDWLGLHRVIPDGKSPSDVPIMTWSELEKQRDKVNLIDIQWLPSYRLGHVSGAVSNFYYSAHVPPIIGNYEWSFVGDNWKTANLPVDKVKPLVIVGFDETDWTAAVATKRAHALGYNAFWYKGGDAEWRALQNWFGAERFPVVTGQNAK